jgi:hypothetical protein
VLVLIASDYVRAFAACHSHEEFYGFAFDCNADYCEVFVCLDEEMSAWGEEDEEFSDCFMQTACRGMVALESSGVLEALNRTDDFMTFVADHDEPDEESWRRLESTRRRTMRP